MVVKDNSSSIPPISIPESTQRSVMDQSSPSSAAFPSSARILAMAPANQQQHVSPYGPPPPADQQPSSAPQPVQPPPSTEHQGQSYSQYSYDIHLRYPQYQQSQTQSHAQAQPPPQFQPQTQPQHLPPRSYSNIPPYTGEPLPPMNFAHAEPSGQNYHYEAPAPQSMDTTGQVPPPGMKPRVTATLWEDESTLCFQVDVKGTCVARREDNHMINGTKLLNVAGMTRGRRDGILKSEKMKHVVKIGPMHLKGVWIPYERALDFANKEKITELLYPLFVHNIGALLHHPINRGYGSHSNNTLNQSHTQPYESSNPTQSHPQSYEVSNPAQQIPRSHEALPHPQSLSGSPPSHAQGQTGSEWKGYVYSSDGTLLPRIEGEQRG